MLQPRNTSHVSPTRPLHRSVRRRARRPPRCWAPGPSVPSPSPAAQGWSCHPHRPPAWNLTQRSAGATCWPRGDERNEKSEGWIPLFGRFSRNKNKSQLKRIKLPKQCLVTIILQSSPGSSCTDTSLGQDPPIRAKGRPDKVLRTSICGLAPKKPMTPPTAATSARVAPLMKVLLPSSSVKCRRVAASDSPRV